MSANPGRLDILKTLNSKSPLSYSDLQLLSGFKTKRESGKFAYHLRKLQEFTFVFKEKSKMYTITPRGKTMLDAEEKYDIGI